jgi:hypothetical protein
MGVGGSGVGELGLGGRRPRMKSLAGRGDGLHLRLQVEFHGARMVGLGPLANQLHTQVQELRAHIRRVRVGKVSAAQNVNAVSNDTKTRTRCGCAPS